MEEGDGSLVPLFGRPDGGEDEEVEGEEGEDGTQLRRQQGVHTVQHSCVPEIEFLPILSVHFANLKNVHTKVPRRAHSG